MPSSAFIICGPTAVGKTAVAVDVAAHFKTEIISADSRQCYRELNIGVAKPSTAALKRIPHHFINSHSIHQEVTAAGFEQYALDAAATIFSSHDKLVMVGGTGLYIKAFCEGMDDIPAIEPGIRASIKANYETNGIAWLQEQLRAIDPTFYETGEMNNPQRMMRALEVKQSTGRSILDFHSNTVKQRDFKLFKIGLELPREQLYERINTRVDQMIEAGLEAEARTVFPLRHLNALQTVGYQELFDHFEGKGSLSNAVQLIKQHTRNYAKRQMTWFRKDPEIIWLRPDSSIVIDTLEKLVKKS